ncbi:MAG: DUF7662 domain-containing protein [Paracoccaceae bacterium]
MSKYDPLTKHLASRGQVRVPMNFEEIERLLGFDLPASARKHRAWWSNNPDSSVITKAWLSAGYQSEQVDLASGKLTFSRLNTVETPSSDLPTSAGSGNLHPLVGSMKGTITIAADFDLTEPAAEDWAEQLLNKFDRLLGRKS